MLYQQIIRISHGLQCNRNNKKRDKKKEKHQRGYLSILLNKQKRFAKMLN